MLVLMGATADGEKELIAVTDGYRESEKSWMEMLMDVKSRGLAIDPKLAVGDGALGFWKALPKLYPTTKSQGCWVHKTANVLGNLPKGKHSQAKDMIHGIWRAQTRKAANEAFEQFQTSYGANYPKACECLAKDREELLAFYDFPAEHWRHLRTSNPIESMLATVRLRQIRTRVSGAPKMCLTMVYRIMLSVRRRWRLLNGCELLQDVVAGAEFIDGINPQVAVA